MRFFDFLLLPFFLATKNAKKSALWSFLKPVLCCAIENCILTHYEAPPPYACALAVRVIIERPRQLRQRAAAAAVARAVANAVERAPGWLQVRNRYCPART